PHYPQSNGQAERFVDTVKRAIAKRAAGPNFDLSEALDDFLLAYRSTPSVWTPGKVSPAEVMFGRKIRTKLDMMRPEDNVEKAEVVKDNISGRIFQENDHVFTRTHYDPHWRTGIIQKKLGTRLYIVKLMEGGKKVRRHVDQIRRRDDVAIEDPAMLPELVKLPRSVPHVTTPSPALAISDEDANPRAIRPTTPTEAPPSRPKRIRTRTKRLQVDPSKKRYDSVSD
uniref:Integrase catalytic domain-containing protein n=1 Tax=Panagrellus redivivus TaxID=6233 RepID=A0A7E4ZQH4_PANRE